MIAVSGGGRRRRRCASRIDRYNALPTRARAAVLERLVQEPEKVRTLERWLEERRQCVRGLDRGLER